MGVKATFIGAYGATLRHVLAWTLLADYNASALVRDASKLRDVLLNLGVSEEIQQRRLFIVEGSSRDLQAVRNVLRSDPEIVFSGITSTAKLQFNPLRPISMNDTTITGDSAIAVRDAVRELKSEGEISNSPIFVPISSTGHSSHRDQPLLLIPLYLWLLPIPQEDTAVLEKAVREATAQPNSALGGYVMLRPPLLTNGPLKGTGSLRVGWVWEDEKYRNDNEQETGVEVGYTIGRLDLARWMFEQLVEGDVQRWNGKCVNITY